MLVNERVTVKPDMKRYQSSGGSKAVADPGFPIGGVDIVEGGTNSRGCYVSKNLYVKTKESGPLGGRVPDTSPLDPPLQGAPPTAPLCVLILFF